MFFLFFLMYGVHIYHYINIEYIKCNITYKYIIILIDNNIYINTNK